MQTIICKPQVAGKPYEQVFQPGNMVVSKIAIKFIDGTEHKVGQRLVVAADSVSYYNVHWEHYSKV